MKDNALYFKKLADEFISKSPDFYNDVQCEGIDIKHSRIVREAVNQFNAPQLKFFRSWAGQDDLGCPDSFSLARGLVRGVLAPAFKFIFRGQHEAALMQSYRDDLSIIRSIGAEGLLRDNPVDLTPGVTNFYKRGGFSANIRWLRYVYLTKRILDLGVLKNNALWVDVGSYYGGLQGLVRRYAPDINVVLVDFHHQLCRSYIYLRSLFPDSNHFFPNEIDKVESLVNSSTGGFFYVPASDFSSIQNLRVDLATNFYSFGEMRRDTFLGYFYSKAISHSRYCYFVNRFVSAPWFEPTYDTDLMIFDYARNDRSIEYLDIFPMHHYQQVDRLLFGRRGFRNYSSSYFELVTRSNSS
jgi:putative sugar O-methyltransferase